MKTSPLLRPFSTLPVLLCGYLAFVATFTFAAELPSGTWPDDAIEGTWLKLQSKGFHEGDVLIALLNEATKHPQTDLALAKLKLDKLVDPSIDINANLKAIDAIVAQIKSMLPDPAHATDAEKMDVIRRYIYVAGAWNNNHPYSYDLDDPDGKFIKTKLLPTYLATRKGNCVSMPILFTILGQRMGLDVTLTTAPKHVQMIYTDRASKTAMYIEATNGGYPQREVWIRHVNPSMTDESIKNGMYLKKLDKPQAISVMAETVAQHLNEKHLYKKTILFCEILLQAFPQNPASMLRIGTAMADLSEVEFPLVYIDHKIISLKGLNHDQKRYFDYLYEKNQEYFAEAESLGWRKETAAENEEYLDGVQKAKVQQAQAQLSETLGVK